MISNYKCSVCGYVFTLDSETDEKWEDIPPDFTCPLCDAPKSFFKPSEEESLKTLS